MYSKELVNGTPLELEDEDDVVDSLVELATIRAIP